MEKTTLSITQAADIAKVGRQAIFCAIKKGRLKASKPRYFWEIDPQDLEEYRIHKYSREKMRKNGELVFNTAEGRYSSLYVCKVLSEALGRPYPTNRLYYMIYSGQLKAHKHGAAWVINAKDAEELLQLEQGRKKLHKMRKIA